MSALRTIARILLVFLALALLAITEVVLYVRVSLMNTILLNVIGASAGILILGARRRVLLRLSLRNLARKRSQVAVAVAGLLVSTSIISGSLVFGDSWRDTLKNIVIRGLDFTDEIVTHKGATGGLDFFPYTTYVNVSNAGLAHVSAVAPRIIIPAAVQEATTSLLRPQATLVGYKGGLDLGQFFPKAGSVPSGDLPPKQVILNNRLANRIEAQVGHTLRVFLGTGPLKLDIVAIVEDRGRGGWQNDEDLFVDLSVAQQLVGQPNNINHILTANVGGPTQGYLVSDQAAAELNATLGPGYTVDLVKKAGIAQQTSNANSLSQLLIVLSSFTIISGLLLIVSIFVMLAEERKTEMGISRALGMRRTHLVQAFLLEGYFYALVSAALGALAGVVVGATIIYVVSLIFQGLGEFIVISILPSSLALAFGIGVLLSLGTIALTSWYVSRLNIVRAIRAIPEPIPRRSTWRQLLLGGFSLAAGMFLSALAFRAQSNLNLTAGISVAALGVAALLLRSVNQRALLTLTGIFLLAWLLKPFSIFTGGGADTLAFLGGGALLAVAGVLIVMANAQAFLTALTAMVRGRRFLPVVRTAIAYPMNKRFRTGMNLAMFALIIFTITTMAMFQALFGSSVVAFIQQFSGGYEIVGFSNPQLKIQNFSAQLQSNVSLAGRLAYHEELILGQIVARSDRMNSSTPYDIVGINSDFVNRNQFTFHALAPGYATPGDAWRAVLADPGLAVVDRTAMPQDFNPPSNLPVTLGGTVQVAGPAVASRTVKVIGVLDTSLVQAVYVAPEVPQALLNLTSPSFFYFKVAAGQDPTAVSKDLERNFLNINLQTFVFDELIRDSIQGTLSFFNLLQGFLALGLIVGIAGLGVVTLRNVAERRNVMGALRALGFRRSMILEAFLLENSFVALLGIALGVGLGIGLAYRLRGSIEFLSHGTFSIPWVNLLLVVSIAYGASLLATFSPARRAARMPPAEALRTAE
jgi:putative ABC transport system permease protein